MLFKGLEPATPRAFYWSRHMRSRAKKAALVEGICTLLLALVSLGLVAADAPWVRALLILLATVLMGFIRSELSMQKQLLGHLDTAREFCTRILAPNAPGPSTNYLWLRDSAPKGMPPTGAQCKVCDGKGHDPERVEHQPNCPVKFAEQTVLITHNQLPAVVKRKE